MFKRAILKTLTLVLFYHCIFFGPVLLANEDCEGEFSNKPNSKKSLDDLMTSINETIDNLIGPDPEVLELPPVIAEFYGFDFKRNRSSKVEDNTNDMPIEGEVENKAHPESYYKPLPLAPLKTRRLVSLAKQQASRFLSPDELLALVDNLNNRKQLALELVGSNDKQEPEDLVLHSETIGLYYIAAIAEQSENIAILDESARRPQLEVWAALAELAKQGETERIRKAAADAVLEIKGAVSLHQTQILQRTELMNRLETTTVLNGMYRLQGSNRYNWKSGKDSTVEESD